MLVYFKEERIATMEELEAVEAVVYNHEDLLADLITTLSNEASFSEETKLSITKIYKKIYGTK